MQVLLRCADPCALASRDAALRVRYDYYPGASSVEQRHLLPSLDASTPPSTFPSALSEAVLWSYATQLLSALHAVHSAGLALYDGLSVRRVLVVGPGRVRVNGVGLRDLLATPQELAGAHHLRQYQQEDLLHLGQLLLALSAVAAPGTAFPPHLPVDVDPALEHGLPGHLRPLLRLCAARYSAELVHLVAFLLTTPRLPIDHAQAPNAHGVLAMVAHRISAQHAHALQLVRPRVSADKARGVALLTAALPSSVFSHVDAVEDELRRELHNGRLFRLLTQINWITDRPQSAAAHRTRARATLSAAAARADGRCALLRCAALRCSALHSLLGDRQWSATGDRYLVSLFRDLLFHSSSDASLLPNVDLAFVVEQLNRLDVGSREKALLHGRDGDALLIVRYADLQRAVHAAMLELMQAAHAAAPAYAEDAQQQL